MHDFLIQVGSGLVVGFILGWFGKSLQFRNQAGRDAQGAQAEQGAAAAANAGVNAGNILGNVDHQIGDRHYGREESPEERQQREELEKRRRVFSLAVHILRAISGVFFAAQRGGHHGLPGYLWHEHEPNWQQICRSIGKFDRNDGRFTPYTEPNDFTGDERIAGTARLVLQWYIWRSEHCPDFTEIQGRHNLPGVVEVREAIGA